MIRPTAKPAAAPQVLVVDDDRRVLELLDIAFTAHGFRVITAADGDEAVRRATNDHPDVLVLDVRLPRKSGLEVCEILRRDPEEAHVPIVLVSAATEADARLRGLASGADDYLSKPFSPKELIARVKRLLVRAASADEARRRADQLQREVQRMQGEVRRARSQAISEARLREIATGPGLELQRIVDEDEIARQLLALVQTRYGFVTMGLFVLEAASGRLVARASRGDTLERLAGLALHRDDDLVRMVHGLSRVVRREELERLEELREALGPFIASGLQTLVALRSSDGLEGLLVADERQDGRPLPREARGELEELCGMAAGALRTARSVRTLSDHLLTASIPAARPTRAAFLAEAGRLLTRAASAIWLPPRLCEHLAAAVHMGLPVEGDAACALLEAAAADDPTGRLREVVHLLRLSTPACVSAPRAHTWPPETRRAALLLVVARGFVTAREAGRGEAEALNSALGAVGDAADRATVDALRAALRELQDA